MQLLFFVSKIPLTHISHAHFIFNPISQKPGVKGKKKAKQATSKQTKPNNSGVSTSVTV